MPISAVKIEELLETPLHHLTDGIGMLIPHVEQGGSSMAEIIEAVRSNQHSSVEEIEGIKPVVDQIIEEYRSTKGALIPVLQSVQNLLGYLPKEILSHISEKLSIPYSEVAGVVTFYSFFSINPRGRHIIRVCLGTACYVRGGKEVLGAITRELKINVGQTTEDRNFSLEIGRCFGACGLAPVVMIDDDVHQRVKPGKIAQLLGPYRTADQEEADEDK
jgi:NADH:ubiquinone oxidoreductase subunit E